MSLFKLKEWWSTKCGSEDEFDRGSLVVGNVDNEPQNAGSSSVDKIVVGSFSGMLRVYHPKKRGFSESDVLLETQLDQPILQLAIGKFIPNSTSNALAVLMEKRLSVFKVESVKDKNAESLLHFSLTHVYSHNLKRLAYNFAFGPFGNVAGKDYICVQSFDGELAFFEQNHFVFARFLSTSILPGPLVYSKQMDSFITYNSNHEVECYKYQVLAASVGSSEKQTIYDDFETDQNGAFSATNKQDNKPAPSSGEVPLIQSGKKVQTTWAVNIGEEVYDIKVGRYGQTVGSDQTEIIVLGERTLFQISEFGKIVAQKRFDFNPVSITLYPHKPPSQDGSATSTTRDNIIIGTSNASLLVYRDPKLIWSASFPDFNNLPIGLGLGSFCGINGMIVMLTDEGHLSLNYLGTDPASNLIPLTTSNLKDFDFAKLGEEHKRLQQLIRQAHLTKKSEPKNKLIIKTSLENESSSASGKGIQSFGANTQGTKFVTLNISLSFTGDNDLENVPMSLTIPKPFFAESEFCFHENNVIPNDPNDPNGDKHPPEKDYSLFTTLSLFAPKISGRGAEGIVIPVKIGSKNEEISSNAQQNPGSTFTPHSLKGQVVVIYTASSLKLDAEGDGGAAEGPEKSENNLEQQQVASAHFNLPLSLCGQVVPQKRVTTCKITLDSNKNAPNLDDLFADMSSKDEKLVSDTTFSFEYNQSSASASILLSKTGARYRIQASSFEALWLVSDELARRLEARFANPNKTASNSSNKKAPAAQNPAPVSADDKEPFKLFVNDKEMLPFNQYFEIIDEHFDCRKRIEELKKKLDKTAQQIRAIQKRFLIRFKERNPTPLNGLEALYQSSHESLIEITKSIEKERELLQLSSAKLFSGTSLILLLMKLRLQLNDKEYNLLSSHLSPSVAIEEDNGEIGWEEATEASMTHLLRTVLAKNAKESSGTPQQLIEETDEGTAHEMPADTKKVKKQIALVFERMLKGQKLIGSVRPEESST